MAEDRLESVISQTMEDSIIAKVMVKRFEKAYPALKTDSALRDKCADFIDQQTDDKPDKDASFSRIAFLAKFTHAVTDYQVKEKAIDPRIVFLKNNGLPVTEEYLQMAEECIASTERDRSQATVKLQLSENVKNMFQDLNDVIDVSYPLVKEYHDMKMFSEMQLHDFQNHSDPNAILTLTEKKEIMYAFDSLYLCADEFIANEKLESNTTKPEETEKLSPLGHAKRAIELVDKLINTGQNKVPGMLAEMETRGKIAKDAMFEFGKVAANREFSGNNEVSALCMLYPELVMVALVQNGDKPIAKTEQLKTLMDNPHNIEMADQYLKEIHNNPNLINSTDTYNQIKDFVTQRTMQSITRYGEGR